MAALLVFAIDDLTLTELASFLQSGLSGLSQAAGRLQKRMRKDRELVVNLVSTFLYHITFDWPCATSIEDADFQGLV